MPGGCVDFLLVLSKANRLNLIPSNALTTEVSYCVLCPPLLLWLNIYVILIFSCWLPKFLALVALSLGVSEVKDWSGCIWTRSTYKINRIKAHASQTLPRRWLAGVTCLSFVSLEKLLNRCSQNAPTVKASGYLSPGNVLVKSMLAIEVTWQRKFYNAWLYQLRWGTG